MEQQEIIGWMNEVLGHCLTQTSSSFCKDHGNEEGELVAPKVLTLELSNFSQMETVQPPLMVLIFSDGLSIKVI